jgi:hypothetical protein
LLDFGVLGPVELRVGSVGWPRPGQAEALTLCRELGERSAEAECLRILADIRRDADRLRQAFENAEAGLRLARDISDQRWVAEHLTTTAGVLDRVGRHAEAVERYRQALAHQTGYRVLEGQALTALGHASLARGEAAEAIRHAEQVRALLAAPVGYRLAIVSGGPAPDHVIMTAPTTAPPRFRTVSSAGTVVALLLVLAFGNSAYRRWAEEHTSEDNVGGFLLRRLTWPGWSFDMRQEVRELVSNDLRAILLVVFTAVFLSLLAVVPGWGFRGIVSAIVAGWGAFIFAAALAGLLAAFVATNASLVSALSAAGDGARYGLFVGWIVGLTTLAFRR